MKKELSFSRSVFCVQNGMLRKATGRPSPLDAVKLSKTIDRGENRSGYGQKTAHKIGLINFTINFRILNRVKRANFREKRYVLFFRRLEALI